MIYDIVFIMNAYYLHIQDFKELLVDYVDNLFSAYDHELELTLANYNVLSRKDNNIESSTAIGYILEEFLITKLKSFTEHKKTRKFLVYPAESPHLSYDCYADYEGIRFLINIKTAKGENNAVAAINKLYQDYCSDDTLKSFVILKIYYTFVNEGRNRKIKISDYAPICIEEIDFSEGHQQDHRSWSSIKSQNSGRLQISNAFREIHAMPIEKISFQATKSQISNIFNKNNPNKQATNN